MIINFYKWSDTDLETKQRLMRRAQANIDNILDKIRPIIADVKDRGDEALLHFAKEFDKADLNTIAVREDEFALAEKNLNPELKAAISHCVQNVQRFHEEQMRRVEKQWMFEVEPGVFAGEKVTPLESVGLYVPRGKNAFPSAMLMLCIPSVIAGVKTIAVCTPPTEGGGADDASLYTAKLCGVETVYKVGGAQAIAALAYGTETVPRVRKVLGPGSPYVAGAKQLLSDVMDPGMPAGPSESIVLADESADPHNTCLDILNEAEHGEDSAALLITHDEKLAEYAKKHLPEMIEDLPSKQKDICRAVFGANGYGGIILTDSLDHSIDIANDYAVEHLFLKVKDAKNVQEKITHTGEIITGEHSTIALANYATGVNHVLPTGGWAHSYSCTSIWDFLKRSSLSKVTQEGFETLKDTVTTMTDYEDFPAHGNSIRKRNV